MDRVDELLDKFFDQHEDGGQLKTLMSKESPGTYHFGARRVTMEADQAGELFVQDGSASHSLANFIANHK